jgi:hypothetical protein
MRSMKTFGETVEILQYCQPISNKLISYKVSKLKMTTPKLNPSSFSIQLSNLQQIAFRAVKVIEIFSFSNVSTGIVEFLDKFNDNEYTNLK